VVLPLAALFILGVIEFGRLMMVQQLLSAGAREGARRAVLAGSSSSDVETTVSDYLRGCGLTGCQVSVTSLAGAQAGDAISVTVRVPYRQATWLPVRSLGGLQDRTLSATAQMIKEAELDS
jgi:Flp pilus assembly protein TadG